MEKLLTISVAAYNIAPYIGNLVESIVKANVSEKIEVLIVNDGSTDDTLSKAYEYEKQYPEMIKLVNKENGGHGSTINKGIECAQGKYFRALDGDDWVNSSALYKLVNRLPNIDADLILSNFCKCYENGTKEIVKFEGLEDSKTYTIERILSCVKRMRYHTVIFKTSILKRNHIKLDENCFYVDTEFVLFPIPFVKNVYFFEDYLYCYRLGLIDQSVSPESRKKNISHSLKVADSLLKLCNDKSLNMLSCEKQQYIVSVVAGHCIWCIQSYLLFPTSKAIKRKIIEFENNVKLSSKDVYKNMGKQGKFSRSINLLRKTRYKIYYFISWYKKQIQVLP